MRAAVLCLIITVAGGCMDDVHQTAGTGAIYTTSCSANMKVREGAFEASCTPSTCRKGYEDVADSHIVVALGADGTPVGLRQRTCLQDLSAASKLFPPDALANPETTQ